MADPAQAQRVREPKGAWRALEWSPDDVRVLLLNYISINESYLHVLDLASGKLTPDNP